MERLTLKAKLMQSGIAAAKVAPVVGSVITVLDDLNRIWRGSDREFDDLLKREADLMANLTKMVEDEGAEIISTIESRFPELRKNILALAELRMSRPQGNIATTTQLIGEMVSGAISDSAPNPEIELASKYIDDVALAILVYTYSRQGSGQSVCVRDKHRLRLDHVHDRELALSLTHLEQLGFLEREQRDPDQYWRDRLFEPDLKEIDDFCETLRVLPIIALMPNLALAGAAQMAEQGRLTGWVKGMRQRSAKVMTYCFSAVRRHPFHGYQWQVRTSSSETAGWRGEARQYGNALDAIQDADKELVRDGQTPRWIFVAA